MKQKKVDEALETGSEQSCAFCEIDYYMGSVFFESEHFLRIPVQTGHSFHSKPATYSSGIRPLIPERTGHPIERYSDAG